MTEKIYDQREDLHRYKQFKKDMDSNSRLITLLACPFCGEEASGLRPERVERG